MEDNNKKTELLVGLFLVAGLLMLGLLIMKFSSVRESFRGKYHLSLSLPDGTGIKEGTPVMLSGSRIGKVQAKPSLNDSFSGVIIPLDIYQDVKIPADAKFSIGTAGLLGDSFIEIKPTGKQAAKFLEPNSSIQGAAAGGLADLKETAAKVSESVDTAVKDIKEAVTDLRTSLKRMNDGPFSEPAMKDLRETFKHLNSVVTRLDEKTFGDKTSSDIKEAMASLKNAASSLEDSVKKLDPAFTKIDSVADKADKAMDSAGSAMKSLDGAVNDIRKGDGLLAALTRDAQLKNEFKQLVTNLRKHGMLFYRDDTGKPDGAKEDESSRKKPPVTGTKR